MHDTVQAQQRFSGTADVAPVGHVSRRRTSRLIALKRWLDVFGSVFGLIVLSPALFLVGAAIRLDSDGPALFRQRRVGRDGKPFYMYKFRTMVTGGDSEEHRQYVTRMITEDGESLRNENGAFKLDRDPRITRVGRWLRKYSLDEFPQLLNVLKGEMSLVGPRPPLPYEVAVYRPRQLRRLEAQPGMTGLWQVSGRNKTTFEEMVDLDLSYIENWSLSLDLLILARTVTVLIKERAA